MNIKGNTTFTIGGNAQFNQNISIITALLGQSVIQVNGNGAFNGDIEITQIPIVSRSEIAIKGTAQCKRSGAITNKITRTTYCSN